MFACQRDSFIRQSQYTVISCHQFTGTVPTSKNEISCWEVVLDDTILFPEGGGQPHDLGTVDGLQVIYVLKRGNDAIHYLPASIEVGKVVEVKVDWERRFDNMQQHSAQHLITALAIKMYGIQTTSWNLLTKSTVVTMDCGKLSTSQLQELEDATNSTIRDSIPVKISYFGKNELPENLRGHLPADHEGDVRVVSFQDLDHDACCGTHVTYTSQLQMVKLLGGEVKKCGYNLSFLAGERVRGQLSSCLSNETRLNCLLNCGPSEYLGKIQKSEQSFKQSRRICSTLLKELAVILAGRFDASEETFLEHHRAEGDDVYMSCILGGVKKAGAVIFVSVGDGDVSFVAVGPKKTLECFGEWFAECGKGNLMPNGRFRGKMSSKLRKAVVKKFASFAGY